MVPYRCVNMEGRERSGTLGVNMVGSYVLTKRGVLPYRCVNMEGRKRSGILVCVNTFIK